MPTLPTTPFEGLESEDPEYRTMMEFIVRVESLQAQALGQWMLQEFPGLRSVIDIGCGPGIYLLPYRAAGCRVLGVDACTGAGECLEAAEFERFDLRFPLSARGWDLAICFEVAEHLPEAFADTLVDSVCEAASLLLWSAAVPGQGGTYHYNERPPAYWLEKFATRGFALHPLQDALRAFLARFAPERARGEVSGWLLDNSFLLVRLS